MPNPLPTRVGVVGSPNSFLEEAHHGMRDSEASDTDYEPKECPNWGVAGVVGSTNSFPERETRGGVIWKPATPATFGGWVGARAVVGGGRRNVARCLSARSGVSAPLSAVAKAVASGLSPGVSDPATVWLTVGQRCLEAALARVGVVVTPLWLPPGYASLAMTPLGRHCGGSKVGVRVQCQGAALPRPFYGDSGRYTDPLARAEARYLPVSRPYIGTIACD